MPRKKPRASSCPENRPCVSSSLPLVSGCRHSAVCTYQGSDTTHTIYYQGHWLHVCRSKKTDSSKTEMLSIRYNNAVPTCTFAPCHVTCDRRIACPPCHCVSLTHASPAPTRCRPPWVASPHPCSLLTPPGPLPGPVHLTDTSHTHHPSIPLAHQSHHPLVAESGPVVGEYPSLNFFQLFINQVQAAPDLLETCVLKIVFEKAFNERVRMCPACLLPPPRRPPAHRAPALNAQMALPHLSPSRSSASACVHPAASTVSPPSGTCSCSASRTTPASQRTHVSCAGSTPTTLP